LIKESIAEFHPQSAMQTEEIKDLDGAVRDAVALKFLDAPLSKDQLAEFLQIPARGK
jgi:NitT/TauT family transport system substrate-binding protein